MMSPGSPKNPPKWIFGGFSGIFSNWAGKSAVATAFFVIFLLLLHCDTSYSQKIRENAEVSQNVKEKDWLMTCCGDEPIRNNRTLVTLGYLTAVKGRLRNR